MALRYSQLARTEALRTLLSPMHGKGSRVGSVGVEKLQTGSGTRSLHCLLPPRFSQVAQVLLSGRRPIIDTLERCRYRQQGRAHSFTIIERDASRQQQALVTRARNLLPLRRYQLPQV